MLGIINLVTQTIRCVNERMSFPLGSLILDPRVQLRFADESGVHGENDWHSVYTAPPGSAMGHSVAEFWADLRVETP